ncbi:double-strand-break repair protein rad21 homolog [Oratosquilla oratoria]|uniref:double-strand-break repair protein rad21 homolog n=1 Tax=Oratosquilla oratoria TaxID=337810 RepID=UPI003F7740E1
MFHSIRKKLRNTTIPFSELTVNNTRKQVAQKFYTMLVLKKLQAVELTQDGAFAELYLSRGHLFDNASL